MSASILGILGLFGWNGQANGYYSLATLSVTSTGREFNGAQHSFNLRLHVIAIHPNKPNTPKIDDDIAYQSPNIKFNNDGMMAFVGDTPTTTSDAAKVMFTGFVGMYRNDMKPSVEAMLCTIKLTTCRRYTQGSK